MYKIVERCVKHGIEIVKEFTSYDEAIQAMKALVTKYKRKAFYYGRLGFEACLCQGHNKFMNKVSLLT